MYPNEFTCDYYEEWLERALPILMERDCGRSLVRDLDTWLAKYRQFLEVRRLEI